MRKISLFLAICFFTIAAFGQEYKKITLEDEHVKGTFRAKSVYGVESMNNGVNYTTSSGSNTITMFEYATGEKVADVLTKDDLLSANIKSFADYSFSDDESKVLLTTNKNYIYRHSFTADYYIFDRKTKTFTAVSKNGAQQSATFSPDGSKVAFVRDNNLFITDITSSTEEQITTDGKFNYIINGACDWVYEEEFGFAVAFKWSPDGKYLAYYKFDESRVKEFDMMEYKNKLYPQPYTYKYPKAGETNSIVSIHTFNLATKETKTMNVGEETNQYISRIKWTQQSDKLSMIRQNRLQNKLEIMVADAASGESKVIYTETNSRYIGEVNDNYVTFLPGNNLFIITAELDGWRHIHLFNMKGEKVRQLTKGNWDVTKFLGYDAKSKRLFYECARTSPMTRDVYSVGINGKKEIKLTQKRGYNRVAFSKGFKYFINFHSTLNTPNYVTMHNAKGKQLRVLEDNKELVEKLKTYPQLNREFFTFTTSEGVSLNGWMLKPLNFDANKKYPVLMTQYSGPNSQQVLDRFDYSWYHYLAQEGYMVVCVDPRGTGARGEDFRKVTYGQLGKYETIDQIEAAKYLGSLDYVDASRIGIWGWSFGGFMSSSCLFKGDGVFKMAVAVAPVINWRYYDSVYTERFMGLPQDNASGYDDNSPINLVDNWTKGKYLLIHGIADDNVHVQNSMELITKLINSNKQFEMQMYPDKNHFINGGKTRLHLYTRMTDFVKSNL
ncbi:MAG: S9 family peptidase [Bacteroidales bacterium]|nr:S9 family peptidase [Bacteroidales bacterium]